MKIAIVGLGLIGGSIGRAVKAKTQHTVLAYDIDGASMLKAALLNAYDTELTEENASEADIFICALYPGATVECLKRFSPLLKDGAAVLDCAGNKRKITSFMKELKEQYPALSYYGFHPMAGREFSGVAHSSAHLFEKAAGIIVPVSDDIEALARIKKFLSDIGFEGVVISKAEEHDKNISYTSQLAHIASSAYIKNPIAEKHYGYSAGSFRDMTRVARLNPVMWSELMLDNRDYLLESLDLYIKNLTEFRAALSENDSQKLERLLKEGNDIKEKVEENKKQKLNRCIQSAEDTE